MNKKAVLTKDLFNIEEPSYMKKFFDNKGKVSIPASHSLRFASGGQMPELTDFNLKNQIQQTQEQPEINVVAQIVDIANSLENYDKIKILAGLNNEQ